MKKLLSITVFLILALNSIINISFGKSNIINNKNNSLINKNLKNNPVKPLIDMSLKNNYQTKNYLDKIFDDENLINKIKKELGTIIKKDDQGDFIYQSDANTVLSLDVQYSNIGSLKGLEIFINLTDLDLDVNPGIVDISPLSKLLNLKKLVFEDNSAVKDFSPLSKLTNLTDLDLSTIKFLDISALANLNNLVNLDLGWDGIQNFSVLENIKI